MLSPRGERRADHSGERDEQAGEMRRRRQVVRVKL